jgi:hypothetical protein
MVQKRGDEVVHKMLEATKKLAQQNPLIILM